MDDRVTIVSETIQEFAGTRYYLCGYYYQHKGKRLHRAVWEYFNGEIQEGYHVHHIDENRHNNDIENLSLMPGIEHTQMHAVTEGRRENGRRAIRIAIELAPEWHRSEEGKEWHRQHAKAVWENHREPHEEVCTECGKLFLSRDMGHKGNHFCHQNCRARYGRRKRRESNKD